MDRVSGIAVRTVNRQVFWGYWVVLLWLPRVLFGAVPVGYVDNLRDYYSAWGAPGDAPRPVRIPATVTYVDPEWRYLFVVDETGGTQVDVPIRQLGLTAGDRVLLEGMQPVQLTPPAIREAHELSLRLVGHGDRPPPVPVSAAQLEARALDGSWIEARGTVRSVTPWGRLQLVLMIDGVRFPAWVKQYQTSDLARLLDARVTVQAVCDQTRQADTRTPSIQLLIPDFGAVRIDEPGPADPYDRPVTPIAQLRTALGPDAAGARVHLRGQVVEQRLGESLTVRDDSGFVQVRTPQRTALGREDRVEVVAHWRVDGDRVFLEDGQFRLVEVSRALVAGVASADKDRPTLTSIAQVLALTPEQARQHYPVLVTGVVTYFNAELKELLIQDGDQGIYVELGEQEPRLQPGQWLEIAGLTLPGGVLNMISAGRLEVKGTRPLPPAVPMNYQEGMSGAFDARRVRVQGTVQSIVGEEQRLFLELVATDGRFYCSIPDEPGSTLRARLTNAVVEAEGVCLLNIDEVGTPASLSLILQRPEDLKVLETDPADRFSLPVQPIGDVRRFLRPQVVSRRLKVRGTVTLWRPGRELILQDATGAIRASTSQTNALALGEEIELIGFRALSDGVLQLLNSEYRPTGNRMTLTPYQPAAADILHLTNQDLLVSMEGRLVKESAPAVAPELLLQNGEVMFVAALEPAPHGELSPAWPVGTRLEVTGVCQLRLDDGRKARSFRLLVRSPADIRVLEMPGWFTQGRLLLLSLVLVSVIVLALAWIAALGLVVRRQTDQIRQRLESEASAERRLALVWDTSGDGMRMTDAQGIVVRVNQAYCRLVRKPVTELEGRSLAVVYRAEEREHIESRYRELFRGRGIASRQETEMVLWDGQPIWFEVTNTYFEQAGFPPLVLSQFRDVSERHRAEAEKEKLQGQLLQSQKMESVGRLAGGVAHDFNNMLQAILGNTTLALEDAPPGPLREALLEIQKSGERSAELTRQLLAFARKQTIRPRVLDLNETVSGLLKMLQRLIGENIQLRWMPGPDLWPVKIDPAQVDQILVNLTVNARDAIADSGQVTLVTENLTVDEAFARTHPDCRPGPYVTFAVSDTGRGLTPEIREHLFEPFFTTKEPGKGTGLGLATVFGIVKQNGGVIDVVSRPGAGTSFRILLPRAETPVPVPAEHPRRPVRGGTETVMFVEDEEQILSLGVRVLRQHGYTVLGTRSAEEACSLATHHPGPIHLLVTDVVMPGMNGRDLARHVQRLRPDTRCLFISGYTADVIAHHGVLEDGIDFLQKPFTVRTLTEKVRDTLEA